MILWLKKWYDGWITAHDAKNYGKSLGFIMEEDSTFISGVDATSEPGLDPDKSSEDVFIFFFLSLHMMIVWVITMIPKTAKTAIKIMTIVWEKRLELLF